MLSFGFMQYSKRNSKIKARGFHLAPWQKQWRAIEKAADIARKNPKFFNPNLTK